MASSGLLENFRSKLDEFDELNLDKVLRPGLGSASLEEELGPLIDQVRERLEFYRQYAPLVADQPVQEVMKYLNNINQKLAKHAGLDDSQYVAQRDQLLNEIKTHINGLAQWRPHFVAAAVEDRGLLRDEGVKEETERAIERLREEADETVTKLEKETSQAIEEARSLAEQIETRARRTAARLSVEDAQEQFQSAQEDQKKEVVRWAIISGLSLLVFLGYALHLTSIEPPQDVGLGVIYFTGVRLTVLAAIGTVTAFCFRLLRAHLHMREHNLHRERVANSIAAFVEAAVTPEQRDSILSRLVEAVVDFGRSGLLDGGSEDDQSRRVTVDTVARSLQPPINSVE